MATFGIYVINGIIPAAGKHVIAKGTLAGGDEGIGVSSNIAIDLLITPQLPGKTHIPYLFQSQE